jgi:hypothetical protein
MALPKNYTTSDRSPKITPQAIALPKITLQAIALPKITLQAITIFTISDRYHNRTVKF